MGLKEGKIIFYHWFFDMTCKLHEEVMLTLKDSKSRMLRALSMSTCLYDYEDYNGPGPSARIIGL